MIRYVITAILIIMVLIVIIVMMSYVLNTLYLVNSISNYTVVIINGSGRLLSIP